VPHSNHELVFVPPGCAMPFSATLVSVSKAADTVSAPGLKGRKSEAT
jgi:hypothetical protein